MNRHDIVGQKIIAAYEEFKWKGIDGWLDYSCTYLKLENGRVFFFVSSVADEIGEEKIPWSAKRVSSDLRKQLEGKTIQQIYRQLDQGERAGESVYIELNDGTHITECAVAPNGTGAAGLYLYTAAEFSKMPAESYEPF